jgi:methionyl-tRNA synthetase
MASFKNLCAQRDDLNFDDFWAANSQAELYHFIGKDIINFHALFWPAMLHDAGFRTPTGVFAHGYVTVNGEKMSKSRGTFIQARTYLDHLEPDYLRYYFAAKLSATVEDIDLNLTDFINRVNSDLIGKVINIASRTAGFITKQSGVLSAKLPHPELYAEFLHASETVAQHYESREYSKAMRLIMSYADRANEYVQQHAPWVLNKDPEQAAQVQAICTQSLNLFRILMTWLQPVLPATALKTQAFLQLDNLDWHRIEEPLLNHAIQPFKPMLARIEPEQIEQLLVASRTHNEAEANSQSAPEPKETAEPPQPTIDFNTFAQVDLRVAKVLAAEAVAGADKLLVLTLDVGATEPKTVFSGIKANYDPADLVGRSVTYVYNLAPRKMKFGTSEGMILAAESSAGVRLLEPDPSLPPGAKIR